MRSFLDTLKNQLCGVRILTDEPLKNHTTFKIGGPADYVVFPESEDELKMLLKACSEYNVKHMIIGNGSNLLFSDEGYRGVILKLAKHFNAVEIEDTKLTARPGVMLSTLAKLTLDNELSGLEFASGIPGTLGGAIYMNAGAYGSEIKDIFVSCRVIDSCGDIKKLYPDDMRFSYRESILQSSGSVVISVTVQLKKSYYKDIKDLMDSYNLRRKDKQPLDFPSAGSTFKRPNGHFAGSLIENAGLKGYSIGGAQVSDKHAGFIVNTGNASFKDVIDLINYVQLTVQSKFDVRLEPEVKIIESF